MVVVKTEEHVLPYGYEGNLCQSMIAIETFFSPVHCGLNYRLVQADSSSQQTGVSFDQCWHLCENAQNPRCWSFSYYEGNNLTDSECWLNLGHTTELWDGLESAEGWRYLQGRYIQRLPPG